MCICHAAGFPHYSVFEVESGTELLDGCLSDILLSSDDVHVILCGDLNGRTPNRFPDTSSTRLVE